MPEKAPKAHAKPRADGAGVLGALPSTRPERLGAPRGSAREPQRERVSQPRAVRAAAPDLSATEPPPEPLGPPTGTELVTTAIRATGELAQIGIAVGGRVLKRSLGRLPGRS